jgi:superfamily II DNA or RNA helicase
MYIGSSDKIKTSKAVLELAKKKQIILATYGMINEGSDIPELDTLIFGTPRTDIEQVVGRIQRKFGDKKPLLVVDPVFSTRINRKMAEKRVEMYEKLGFTRQGA